MFVDEGSTVIDGRARIKLNMTTEPERASSGASAPASSGRRHPVTGPASRHGTKVEKCYRRHHHGTQRLTAASISKLSTATRHLMGYDGAGDSRPSPGQGVYDVMPGLQLCPTIPAAPGQFPISAVRDPPSPLDPNTTAFVRWQTPFSWFRFPAEIRKQIYHYMLQMPTSTELYSGYYKEVERNRRRGARRRARDGIDWGEKSPHPSHPRFKPRLKTPTILLLCRAITCECLSILRASTFVVDRIPPWIPGQPRPLMVSQFIGRLTLQKLRRIDIRIDLGRGSQRSGWIWLQILNDLLDVLAEWNEYTHLRILVRMFQRKNLVVWHDENKKHNQVHAKLAWFRGKNRNFWSPGVIDLEHWDVSKEGIFTLNHKFERDTRISDFPNAELIPGSITDFITEPPQSDAEVE